MMRRPYNFIEERRQKEEEVEEEEELDGDYDMFSAYPFLTERTPPKKVPLKHFDEYLILCFKPHRRKKGGGLKASPAQKTSPSSFPWNVQLEGASGPCAGIGQCTS